MQTTYTGNQQDRVRQALARQSERDRRDWLREAVEAVPDAVVQETDFGRYESKTEVQPDGRLVHVRHVEVTEPTLPPEEYGAFRAFMQRAVQADRAQFVLVQKGDAAPR